MDLKVPLTGLEPVVSALRGRRVNHLHYSGITRCQRGFRPTRNLKPTATQYSESLKMNAISHLPTCQLANLQSALKRGEITCWPGAADQWRQLRFLQRGAARSPECRIVLLDQVGPHFGEFRLI
jgi:hypothetical protein